MPIIETQFPFAAVLWDMDGTLIDSEPIWIEEECRLMRSFGVDWSEVDSHHCLGGPVSRVDAYMRQRAGNIHQPLELSKTLISRVIERLRNGVSFTSGAQELIEELHSAAVPMALVTASTSEIMLAALDGVGSHYFKATISCDDVIAPKPEPEGYIMAAEMLGVPIERSLIIEDSIPGMTAAISSGAYVLGIPHLVELPLGERVRHLPTLRDHSRSSISALFAGMIS